MTTCSHRTFTHLAPPTDPDQHLLIGVSRFILPFTRTRHSVDKKGFFAYDTNSWIFWNSSFLALFFTNNRERTCPMSTATARVLRIHADRVGPIPAELEDQLRARIHAETVHSMQSEAQRVAEGKLLTSNPLSRLLIPPTRVDSLSDYHLGPGEQIEVFDGQSLRAYQLVKGETGYLEWRRQWGIFLDVLGELRSPALNLTKRQRWETMYRLFMVGYGVMACTQTFIDGKPHLACGIRSQKLDTRNIGMLTFPSGMVRPFETLERTLRRVIVPEGSAYLPLFGHGWGIIKFPDVPSLTFGRLAKLDPRGKAVPPKLEVEGKTYVWIPQTAVSALIAGDPTEAKLALDAQGIEIPLDPETNTRELQMAHDARFTFAMLLGLGML